MPRTFTKRCQCCGASFDAKNHTAKWCSTRCSMRAYQRRRRGVPEADPAMIKLRQPQVLQPQILPPAPAASALAPFAFAGHQVRVITDEQGMPWFVAADVCAVLEFGNSRQVLTRLDPDEKGVHSTDTPGGTQSMTTVNESGLYALILGSRKPEARAFKRWVTHEVLPAIRRTGRYTAPEAASKPPQLSEGVHVVAATPRRAAELWWEAIQSEVTGALARRLNPTHRTDAGLPLVVSYSWQPSLL